MKTFSERYAGFGWIQVPRYVMNETLAWEERYRQLDEHHVRETTFLIDEVRNLAREIDELRGRAGGDLPGV